MRRLWVKKVMISGLLKPFALLYSFFLKMLSNDSAISSARVMTFFGGAVMGYVLLQDSTINKHIDNAAYLTFAAYCSGQFLASKGLDVVKNYIQQKEENANTNN